MEFQRYFSRAEAVSTLPLVKRIVSDILDTGRNLRRHLEENTDSERMFTEDPIIQDYRAVLLECLSELESMGCFYKDWNFEIGLVDFPAILDEKQVFLCWRSDEPALAFYHQVEHGYSGREPLPPDWTGQP